jgi:hypothetical protein
VIAPLTLAGKAHGRALLAYVLLLGAAALVLLIDRLRRALPRTPFRRSARQPAPELELHIDQLEKIRRAVESAAWGETYVFESLRPIVREIVATGLMRRHGVDLDRSPLQAHSILGDGCAWDLARPDRTPPREPRARGWSLDKIDTLLDELEAL